MLATSAHAGPYAEIGLSHPVSSCIYQGWTLDKSIGISCSDSPWGSVAVGYTYKNWAVEAYHVSSLVERDKGLNLISVKYRIGK